MDSNIAFNSTVLFLHESSTMLSSVLRRSAPLGRNTSFVSAVRLRLLHVWCRSSAVRDGCGMCCRGQHCCVASSHPTRVGSLVDHRTLMFSVCCMKLSSLPGGCYRSLLMLPSALSRPVRCGHHRWRTRWLCGCHQSGSTRHEGTTLSASHLVRQCLPISTNRMNNLASGLLTLGRSPVLRSEERLVALA